MPCKRKRDGQVSKKVVKEEENNAESSVDFTGMTIAQLKKECETRGIESSGVKKEIIKRLQEFDDAANEEVPKKVAKVSELKKAKEELKKTIAKKKSKRHKVDEYFPIPGARVYGDYACMLNQTNIAGNNNKYYVIQILEVNGSYHLWTRWGRVGEPGAHQEQIFNREDDAIKGFEKKFQDKTKNNFENRNNFVPKPGKYTLIEMDEGDDDSPEASSSKTTAEEAKSNTAMKLELDEVTAGLVKFIYDTDMFKESLSNMEIDLNKMPLGKLSKAQILKGFAVLEKIEEALNKGSNANFCEMSNEFYTIIPHAFGRKRPTIIDNNEILRKKLDVLITLGDVEQTLSLLKESEASKKPNKHPTDVNYELLHCDLVLLKKSDREMKLIEEYFKSTSSGYPTRIINAWKVNRHDEDKRFAVNDSIPERKLLWHGTNVAVVAAILKSGLRIMPHSGGRVGAGIYFASQCSKSAQYVCPVNRTGIMFLNEVVLGKEYTITMDDCTLRKAPDGFNSVVARGIHEPDPRKDAIMEIDGKKVVVPQGNVIRTKYSKSNFSESEYLIYNEHQCRIRFLLQMEF